MVIAGGDTAVLQPQPSLSPIYIYVTGGYSEGRREDIDLHIKQ